ncbi:MAG: hypothetical protein LBP40_03250 [Campylobacteraceae bacterium]|jgi:ABC-type glycerol-3-phosphate transport system substrate-binding protein|nr:hypothetical protein [Campylobacteraceae bacterium]
MVIFKSYKLWLKTLFLASVLLVITGCGGNNNDNEASATASSIYHVVSFYDGNLDLISAQSHKNGTDINFTAIDGGVWYISNKSEAVENYTVRNGRCCRDS